MDVMGSGIPFVLAVAVIVVVGIGLGMLVARPIDRWTAGQDDPPQEPPCP